MKPVGRVGDVGQCPSDSHGCPSCPHSVQGPAVSGSSNVLINNVPALRQGDPGTHSSCCGANTWIAAGGSATVLINGKMTFRQGDPTAHCGGSGQLMQGSGDVVAGG